jgi:outer membrane lipoprotein SlyB
MTTSSVAYDPAVIQQFAAKLYDRARTLVWSYAALGFFLGSPVGVMTAGMQDAAVGALVSGVLGAAIGAAMASERAFILKLQAQTALCQAQIEANTRQALAMQAARPIAALAPSMPESAMLRRA